ncbi:hypothetical protein CYPRO_1360 [Cyclonatronum proteinivorum]|uniref:Uncharacterized protein n=1 Tax=Cyclonatronum proteinivorum TaxID=1457365 RepID=A0A345UJG4_9BACT|nr:hypothetical protein CYPRO_1360 [Cyclonatronum proteinivorum]
MILCVQLQPFTTGCLNQRLTIALINEIVCKGIDNILMILNSRLLNFVVNPSGIAVKLPAVYHQKFQNSNRSG